MNEKTIRALVEAGAVRNVLIIADGATVHVDIITQNGPITATTNKGGIKTWVTLDASAKWVKALGIGRAQLEISRWLPGQEGVAKATNSAVNDTHASLRQFNLCVCDCRHPEFFDIKSPANQYRPPENPCQGQ